MLPELLGRATKIPVAQAVDGVRVAADHVYVIPPNTSITVTDGQLRVSARSEGRGPHLPIDALLRSLAVAYGSDGVGVVLSGTGSDGTRAVRRGQARACGYTSPCMKLRDAKVYVIV